MNEELSDDIRASAWSCMDDYQANLSDEGSTTLYLHTPVGDNQSKVDVIQERSFNRYHFKRFVYASELTILAYSSINEYSIDPEIQAGGDNCFTIKLH